MPYDESLAARVTDRFSARRVPAEAKRMMGGLCFMVRGKMCVGVERARLMVRLDPEVQAAALARPGCTPMDFTGRPLRGFVYVGADHLRTDPQLDAWLDLALDYNPRAAAAKRRKPRRAPG